MNSRDRQIALKAIDAAENALDQVPRVKRGTLQVEGRIRANGSVKGLVATLKTVALPQSIGNHLIALLYVSNEMMKASADDNGGYRNIAILFARLMNTLGFIKGRIERDRAKIQDAVAIDNALNSTNNLTICLLSTSKIDRVKRGSLSKSGRSTVYKEIARFGTLCNPCHLDSLLQNTMAYFTMEAGNLVNLRANDDGGYEAIEKLYAKIMYNLGFFRGVLLSEHIFKN